MKKIFALLAVIGLGLSMIGCEPPKPAATPAPSGGAPAATEPAKDAPAEPAKDAAPAEEKK